MPHSQQAALGAAYFSSRVARHVRQDLGELVRHGFSWVNFPLTEQDVRFAPGLARDLVCAAHDAGLEAWLSPWGVGGVFGGEGISAVAHHGPRSPEVRSAVNRWLGCALEAEPDALFWDEPRDRVAGEGLSDLLEDWLLLGRTAGLVNHVCFEPGFEWPDPRRLTTLTQTVGTDPYDWQPTSALQAAYVQRHVANLEAYARVANAQTHLWVRAFRVAKQEEARALAALRAAIASGVGRVGLWSYGAGEGLSCLASERGGTFWARLLGALRENEPAASECA